MTVIAVGVVNKQGHIVFSRNFNEISRIRIEGLLSAFPRLMESSPNKQVTYIDAGTVRYVYQPLEELFLVLITTRNSNIVEDLAALHLMARLIPEYVQCVSESALQEKVFKIFFALDEVIVGGRRENATAEQIQTYLKMDSHEEMMVREEKRMRMERAKKDASKKARELRDKRQRGINPYSGIGSDDHGSYGFSGVGAPVVSMDLGTTGHHFGSEGVAAGGFSSGGGAIDASKKRPARVGGLSLGKTKKADIAERVLKEAGLPLAETSAGGASHTEPSVPGSEGAVEGLHITVVERISAKLGRGGEGGATEVVGELSVLVSDPKFAHARLVLSTMSGDFSFRAHAKVLKELFAESRVLAMRDDKPFPLKQSVSILRWSLTNASYVRPPIILSCWPEGDSITVEYELANDEVAARGIDDIRIAIPVYGAPVSFVRPSVGYHVVHDSVVFWHIPKVDSHSNLTGTCEVGLTSASAATAETFFPVDISFNAHISLGGVSVVEATQAENGMPIRFSQEVQLLAKEYTVS
ncbi:putative Clathrin adaptor complex small chain Adaptor complexes medium subunit family [Trypanosoma vivax]|nr:putative coatomer delta subunit [Trypanosoma vivax]KAH8609142.1 putative Clathrin adaptor complex small chain Adaptor complexes medium subunit family [Trypanosoma vivax]